MSSGQQGAQNWGSSGSSQSGQSSMQDQAISRGTLALIQRRLRDYGYSQAPADGLWRPDTQQALEIFQESNGLQPSGKINLATLEALGIIGVSSNMSGGNGQSGQSRQYEQRSGSTNGTNQGMSGQYGGMGMPSNQWQSGPYGFVGRGTIPGQARVQTLPDGSVPYRSQ